MRKLRKGECYALLRTIRAAIITTKRSPLRSAHRDDGDRRGGIRVKQGLQQVKNISILSFTGLICFIVLFSEARAQSAGEQAAANGLKQIEPLLVGQKVPEDFWTRKHVFFVNGDTIRKDLAEYRGKLLILDSWATWCGTCLQNFGKKIQMEREFRDELNILLVNSDNIHDNLVKIEKVLSNGEYFDGEKEVSIVFDRYLSSLFPYQSIPRYVWIDRVGIIRAITTFDFVSSNQIQTILNRKNFSRKKGADDHE